MHQELSKSPITYVLAQIKFSNIPSIETKYLAELQDSIRQLFPHFKSVNFQSIELRQEQQPISSLTKQWHFIDKDLYTGIILDESSITIHTSKYSCFEILFSKLENILTKFHKILGISLLTRIGLRYINLVKSDLDKLNPTLLGFALDNDKFFEMDKFLTKVESTQISKQGIIKLQSTHIGNLEVINSSANNNIFFVPPDLINSTNFLSFEHYQAPTNSFLSLDIDHFCDYSKKPLDFNIPKIKIKFDDLQDAIYHAFCDAVGKEALSNWNIK